MVDVDGQIDGQLASLAEGQHGVVARKQLLELGLGPGAVDKRLKRGRLRLLHRGVYAVAGAPLSVRGRWLAAVLACGPGALLSHRSAAALWDLIPVPSGPIDVTAGGCRRNGIRVHRSRRLHDEDRSRRESTPVTSVARTVVDLAATLAPTRLRNLVERAERLGLFDLGMLERARERGQGRRGMRKLGIVLADHREPPLTRSALERRFFEVCLAGGLPAPAMNVVVEGIEVDALWREQRLVVELDGYEFHRSRGSFERDRERDSLLQLAGYRVLRLTARRIAREPAEVITIVGRLLCVSESSSAQRGIGGPKALP